MRKLLVLGAIALLAACAKATPEPIRWGTDTCEQCRMVLADRRFGAEIVGPGRVYKFDGIDELGKYIAAHPGAGTPYIVDAESGANVRADQAVFLSSASLRGPMGGHVVGFANHEAGARFATREGLKAIQWPTLANALLPIAEGPVDAGH